MHAAPRTTSSRVLWSIIAISFSVHAASLVFGRTLLAEWRWEHHPVHSAVEMSGSVIALLVAWLLISLERRGEGTSFNIWIAAALIGMGVLDGLHALVHAGNAFVWLHSMATFVGGLLFMMIWVPHSYSRRQLYWWPESVLAASLAFGLFALLFPHWLPVMVEGSSFTLPAKVLNLSGGAMLLVAALRLVFAWRKTHNNDDLLFCLHCGLFGFAAIMFEQSKLWDLPWWGWHVLRLIAYLVAIWFVILTDLRVQSKMVDIAESLRELNENLERRVRERTLQLAMQTDELERQRSAAVDLAEKLQIADRAKSEFLANMSHEIRTPMNAIMGLTELVLHSKIDDMQRDYLCTVMDSADSLLSIINDILDFSKIEAGMLQVEQVRFCLEDVVGDSLRSQALRAQQKGLELACFVEPDLPNELLGDPGRLRQVLVNLVGNAIKFTNAGEVVLRVEREPSTSDCLMLRVSVQDTGIGIAAGKLKSIFNPFEQADNSTTREHGGTGLGLAICRNLVSLMGGEMGVESELHKGSTFWFTAKFRALENGKPPVRSQLNGTRVLVVDDNATNRTILEQNLLALGLAPVLSSSAHDAFEALQQAVRAGRPFRLLISDVHMPEIDGFGLAEMIRSDDSLQELEIILLSSAGQLDDQRRCQELRVVAQLTKPVKQSELSNAITGALGGADPSAQAWFDPQQAAEEDGQLPALRILLVEDSLANQKVALAVLAGAGHTLVVANHGQEALASLETQKFDVILMDVQMPVMDGMETTAAIRAAEQGTGRHQPIVAMTAHAMQGDRERFLSAGMDAYVSKPVSRSALVEAIASAIGRGSNSNSTLAESNRPQTKTLVDWSGALRQLQGDVSVLLEITQAYIDETRDNLQHLEHSIANAHASEALRMAHTVKGAMRFFHAEAAMRIAQSLEDSASTGELSDCEGLCQQLKSEVDSVMIVLQRFVETGKM